MRPRIRTEAMIMQIESLNLRGFGTSGLKGCRKPFSSRNCHHHERRETISYSPELIATQGGSEQPNARNQLTEAHASTAAR